MARAPDIITPYRNADCSSFSGTTWVATIAGTDAQPVLKLLIESTCDQDLEFGFVAGTGNTAAFYWMGTPHTAVLDFSAGFINTTLYVRKLAGGTTPTASTKLLVSALG